MPTVKIKQISPSAVLRLTDYYWLLERLNTALPLMSVTFYRDSTDISTFAIYKEDGCISVFPNDYNITYEVNYNG